MRATRDGVFFENRQKCLNYGKKAVIVSIFEFNFLFKMQFQDI